MKTILLFTLSTFKFDARVKTYANYLKECGIKVIILSSKEKNNENIKDEKDFINYRIIKKYQGTSSLSYIMYYLQFFLKACLWVPYLFVKYRFEIVHYNNAPNFIIFSCLLPKLFGTKLILDNHDIFSLVLSSKFNNKILDRIAYAEQRYSMKFANEVICADHNQAEYLRSLNFVNKITVVLNVPSPLLFKKNEIKKNDNQYVNVVYHGTISYRLGIDQIILAFNKIRDKIPRLKFHLIGTGDYLDEIELLNNKLNLNEIVHIYGKNIPVEELAAKLSSMDIGIIGNRTFELSDYMLPVKLLEYVYMGLSVIAPKNKIISKYFTDEMICFYTPENIDEMSQKILYLYSNKDVRQQYTEKANEFSQKYNYFTEMNKYQNVLNTLEKKK